MDQTQKSVLRENQGVMLDTLRAHPEDFNCLLGELYQDKLISPDATQSMTIDTRRDSPEDKRRKVDDLLNRLCTPFPKVDLKTFCAKLRKIEQDRLAEKLEADLKLKFAVDSQPTSQRQVLQFHYHESK
mgnify:CR=1 FL=1